MTIETNAEQLERIKSMVDSKFGNEGYWNKIMPKQELAFLIEQAERAQELELMNSRAADTFQQCEDDYVAENARLREGLKSLSKEVGRHGVYGGFISKSTSTNIQWDIDEILQQKDSK